jgi:hypothetical protein
MPKRSRELSAMEVGRLREEGDHNVGGIPGLYLQIIDGSRSWILRCTIEEPRGALRVSDENSLDRGSRR